MKILILIVSLFILIGCQDSKVKHERVVDTIEREVKENIAEHLFLNRNPCIEKNRDKNPNCNLGQIDNPQLSEQLHGLARQHGLSDITLLLAVDSNGKQVQLFLKDFQQAENGKKFTIERRYFDPSTNREPREGTEKTIAEIIPFEGSTCLRWAHNVVVGGTYYTDYCRAWVN
ncbi:MAG: hypothetical protein MRJ52_03560 [Nitrosomonas sp.]|nr:hypothetical protein [Nitrosomonas sp.]